MINILFLGQIVALSTSPILNRCGMTAMNQVFSATPSRLLRISQKDNIFTNILQIKNGLRFGLKLWTRLLNPSPNQENQ
uniref:Uncharacterized protein n=1 Tax=Romanomermis culicivorax TaxID=13658 RepID=A0A915IVA6_ROMCU